MNPEQLTSTPTMQDLLNEEIQKLAMRTHLEVHQQREDIRRDLAARMKFVPPEPSSRRKCVFTGKKIRPKSARTEIWKMVEGGNHCCQGSHGSYQYLCDHFLANVSKLMRPLGTLDLEELPDSRERAGAPVLWLSCEGHKDVWELFSGNSHLSAILDRQGLLVAAPIDLRTKKS